MGWIVALIFGGETITEIVYDGWGESGFSPSDVSAITNDHHICAQNNTGARMSNIDLESIGTRLYTEEFTPTLDDIRIFEDDTGPYNCEGMRGGAVAEVTLDTVP